MTGAARGSAPRPDSTTGTPSPDDARDYAVVLGVAATDCLAAAALGNDPATAGRSLAVLQVITSTPPERVVEALRRLIEQPAPSPVPITNRLRHFAAVWCDGRLPKSA